MRDYHVHIERGPYTREWLEKFVEAGRRVGVYELGLVEHLYLFRESHGILHNPYIAEKPGTRRELAGAPDLVGATLDRFATFVTAAADSGLPVKCGLEVDYVPGAEEATNRLLKGLPLDFVIGSLHWLGDWGFDIDQGSWSGRSVEAAYRQYYGTLAAATESGLFDIIGHPGNIAYFGHRPQAETMEEMEAGFFERARAAGVVLEVNTGGLLRPVGQTFPRPETWPRIQAAGIPIVVCSDAHRPDEVAHDFPLVHRMLKEVGFAEAVRFERRKRVVVEF